MPNKAKTIDAKLAPLAAVYPWLARLFPFALGLLANIAVLLACLKLKWVEMGVPILMIFLIPVILSAFVGGLWPGLMATVTAGGLSIWFILPPDHSFQIASATDVIRWMLMNVIGLFVSLISEALRRSRERARTSERLQTVTLNSITYAVISTDASGRITFMNQTAEHLTGWSERAAAGRALSEVFKTVDGETRHPLEDPVKELLRPGSTGGLAGRSVLTRRDGRELPVESSGAPIKQGDLSVLGVVLIFRDCTEDERAEAALRLHQKLLSETGRLAQVGFSLEVRDSTARVP